MRGGNSCVGFDCSRFKGQACSINGLRFSCGRSKQISTRQDATTAGGRKIEVKPRPPADKTYRYAQAAFCKRELGRIIDQMLGREIVTGKEEIV